MSLCSDAAREALAEVGVAEVLTYQLKRAPDAERRHLILEVLGSLGESGEPHFQTRSIREPGSYKTLIVFCELVEIWSVLRRSLKVNWKWTCACPCKSLCDRMFMSLRCSETAVCGSWRARGSLWNDSNSSGWLWHTWPLQYQSGFKPHSVPPIGRYGSPLLHNQGCYH